MIEINKIYNEDCLDVLKGVDDNSVQLILQDPPYNTTNCEWEWDIFTKIDEFWREWKRIIKDDGLIIMTATQPFSSKLVMSNIDMFKYDLVWDKISPVGFLDANRKPLRVHEYILIFGKSQKYNPQFWYGEPYVKKRKAKPKSVYGASKENMLNNVDGKRFPTSILPISNAQRVGNIHPTQKPVELFEYLIKTYSDKGDIVFDGFSGSGTTAVACLNTDRNFICCELKKEYYDKSLERLKNIPKRKDVSGCMEW